MFVYVAQQFQPARGQHLGQRLKRVEGEVIFPDLLALLISTHRVFNALADGFEPVTNMYLQLAHGSPPAFRTSAKKSANSWSRLLNVYGFSVPAMCMCRLCPARCRIPQVGHPVAP